MEPSRRRGTIYAGCSNSDGGELGDEKQESRERRQHYHRPVEDGVAEGGSTVAAGEGEVRYHASDQHHRRDERYDLDGFRHSSLHGLHDDQDEEQSSERQHRPADPTSRQRPAVPRGPSSLLPLGELGLR